MIKITVSSKLEKTTKKLHHLKRLDFEPILRRFGEEGVTRLAQATPIDSGETASSWTYVLKKTGRGYSLEWKNTSMAGSTPVVILIQYGHGTKNGGYVQPNPFVNEAIRPTLNELADSIRKEVQTNV